MTTLVTAWIPAGQAPHHTVREIDEYVLLARSVFSLGLPVIAFVHESIESQLARLAQDLGTDVIFVSATTHVTSPERTSLISALIKSKKTPSVLTNPNKDTADYICIQLSKADWMLSASKMTDDVDLWWIDLGLAHISPVDASHQLKIPEASQGVIACDESLVAHMHTLDLKSRNNSEWNWPIAAGGLFGVKSSFIQEFQKIWWDQIDVFINNQVAPTDELILSHIALHDGRITTVDGIHQRLFASFGNYQENSCQDSKTTPLTKVITIPSLSNFESARVVDLLHASSWDLGWTRFNPSIASDSAGTILCLVRSSNYTVDGYTYTTVDNNDAIKTHTQCLTLDSEFNILDSHWIAEPEIVNNDAQFPVHGIEDMRLSFNGLNWIVTGTIRQHDPEGICRQIIAKLNVKNYQLEDVHIMPSPTTPWRTNASRVHEKNWLALESSANRQELVWSTNPLVVLEWDWVTCNLGPKIGKAQILSTFGLRGSTPFIDTPIGRLGMVHEVSKSELWPHRAEGPARRYTHRFVLIGEKSNPPKVSESFNFLGEGLEYAAGLMLIDSRIVISFGQNDQTAHLLEINLNEVQKLRYTWGLPDTLY